MHLKHVIYVLCSIVALSLFFYNRTLSPIPSVGIPVKSTIEVSRKSLIKFPKNVALSEILTSPSPVLAETKFAAEFEAGILAEFEALLPKHSARLIFEELQKMRSTFLERGRNYVKVVIGKNDGSLRFYVPHALDPMEPAIAKRKFVEFLDSCVGSESQVPGIMNSILSMTNILTGRFGKYGTVISAKVIDEATQPKGLYRISTYGVLRNFDPAELDEIELDNNQHVFIDKQTNNETIPFFALDLLRSTGDDLTIAKLALPLHN